MPTVIQGITFYTLQETAKALGVSVMTVRNYIKKEKLKTHRIGRPLLILEEDLMRFVTEFSKV